MKYVEIKEKHENFVILTAEFNTDNKSEKYLNQFYDIIDNKLNHSHHIMPVCICDNMGHSPRGFSPQYMAGKVIRRLGDTIEMKCFIDRYSHVTKPFIDKLKQDILPNNISIGQCILTSGEYTSYDDVVISDVFYVLINFRGGVKQ
jgi:hypothetical protein